MIKIILDIIRRIYCIVLIPIDIVLAIISVIYFISKNGFYSVLNPEVRESFVNLFDNLSKTKTDKIIYNTIRIVLSTAIYFYIYKHYFYR